METEPTNEERIQKLKNIIICLTIICIVLFGANIYQRTQVVACRNTAKSFITDISNIFSDEEETFEASTNNAQQCNSWPK